MVKKFLFFVLLSIPLIAQIGGGKTGIGGGASGGASSFYNAIDFDGSSEYLYRNYSAADSFLNLNGYERIQNSNSRDFESTVGTWLNKGNHAIDTNTANKIFGNKSGRIIASGAGDSLSNFVCLVAGASSYHGVSTNNKYTVELWNKSIHAAAGDSFVIYHGGLRKSFLCSTTLQKAVFNYTATSYTVARDSLKIYTKSASGDTLIIDSVNISQAYDMVAEVWIANSTNASQAIVNRFSYLIGGWQIGITTSNRAYAEFGSVGQDVTCQAAVGTLPIGTWSLVQATFNRTDSIRLYTNGINLKNDICSSIGSTKNTTPTRVGVYSASLISYYIGYIGELRLTRFDNISQSNWTTTTPLSTYNSYTRGVGFTNTFSGGNPKVMLWLDFQGTTDSQVLQDLSGNGYNMTGNNVTTTDQIRWRR